MALFVLAVLVCHRRDHTNVAPIHIMSSVIAACNPCIVLHRFALLCITLLSLLRFAFTKL